jgi:CubicO group peptidase (beta-lactamase class C family)
MSRRFTLLVLGSLGVCGQPAAAQALSPDTARLRREIPRLIGMARIPGLAMAVVQSGRVTWAAGFGTVNDGARSPVDTATIFEAASLSKPVFAYLVLRLADRGAFDLDRPLHEMLEYPRLAHDERYRRVTARIVLSHGTGLPNWGGDTLRLRFDPGTAYGYSGEGFVFLQKALEQVTGRPLDELARQEVFQPLGMTRSSFVWQERFAGNAAYGRNWRWHVAPVHHYVEANAAASLLTTAPDYARFVAAVLTGRGLSPTTWRAYLTPVRESSPGIFVGLGIRVEDGPDGRIFYHSGNNGRRFTCYMTGDVASGLGLVYFTNASNGTTLVEALASPVFGAGHPARHRAGFDRYDDPQRLALLSIQEAAVERGPGAARARFRAVRESDVDRLSFENTLQLGEFLVGRRLGSLSIEVLQAAVADAPDSAEAHLALGRAYESAGNLESAIASYRRAMALDGDSSEAELQIRWVRERLAARARPVAVPRRTLESYAGRYQELAVTARNGRLYYADGGNAESPLTPMTQNLFEVEADPGLRIRFVGDGVAPASRLIGVYSDGSTEVSARSR